MKRLLMTTLSILILGIFLTSCTPKSGHVQGDIVVHTAYVKCAPKPPKPKYAEFIKGEYLLGPRNSGILLDNLELKENYLNMIEPILDCYINQAK